MQDSALVELRLLGSVRLQASDGRDVEALVRHAKRTALLAYLAAARPRGPHRRDTLLAMFWPEFDSARARAALSQALYVVREALGSDAIVGDGAVAVDGAVVWCDVAAFEAALDAGRSREALDLYRGDLLEGFFVTGAPEFERWLERERARLRERASEGAWALADERATAGDVLEAERWARRAADLLPADEAVARRLVAFLHRLGDRAAAIRAYEEFTARLAREYELEPSAETQALAAAIRAEEGRPTTPQPAVRVVTGGEAPAPPSLSATGQSLPVARKRAAPVLALMAVALLAGGWLLVRGALRARTAADARTPKRLVVLPFTNLGPADEEYFTDGVTEELTARLSTVGDLRVIASTSANLYKHRPTGIRDIGAELGVDYVLEGSVRWEKSAQGPPRVRITPQLITTRDATHLWAEVYDEPLDEIFRVQGDIAQKVVQALDVQLLEPQRREIQTIPTRSLQAYDYYLRGNDYAEHRGTGDGRAAWAAVQMYQKAIELDSNFALAYAMLSRVHSRIYMFYMDRSPERLAMAKRAVDRALQLDPGLPEAHGSLAAYYFMGKLDYDRALREFATVEASRPNDAQLFHGRGALRVRQGKLREALADYARAQQLDPRSESVAISYGYAYDLVRDFPHAESLYTRALTLAPDKGSVYFQKTWLYLRWDGTTQRARAVLAQARAADVTLDLLSYTAVLAELFDRRYGDALARLKNEAPDVMESRARVVPRAQLYAQVYGLMGRHELEHVYYDSARSYLAQRIAKRLDDARLHGALGIAYAGLGRKQEAVQEGERGVALLPVSKEEHGGYYRVLDLARIYTMVGEYDAAIDRLAYLLSIPGHLTRAWLRVDPTWDALRGHPRFQQLVTGG